MFAHRRFLVAAIILFIPAAVPETAEAAELRGSILDRDTAQPLALATVELFTADHDVPEAITQSDDFGDFVFRNLKTGAYRIAFSRIGYARRTIPGAIPQVSPIQVFLVSSPVVMEYIVVTASRSREPHLVSPASVSVVGEQELQQTVQITPVDVVRSVAGVDFARTGLFQHTYSARGQRGVNSTALLLLTDYRYAFVPSLGFNISYLLAQNPEDTERIEVIRGPGAALYGPDADRGVVHVLTRPPFGSAGTRVSVTAGERELGQISLRQASTAGENLAIKVSAEYLRGMDWKHRDPVEVINRETALGLGADPETLLVGRRDFQAERMAGDARIDWRPDASTTVVMSGGLARAANAIDLTPSAGAVQIRDWTYGYLQSRLRRDRLFVNLLFNASHAGDTYFLRTGDPVVDESRMWGAQVQHSSDLGRLSPLLYGVDVRSTIPRTGDTIHGRNEKRDTMTEVGAYAHSTISVAGTLNLVTALRADYHDRLDNLALSPRIGAHFQPSEGHAVRLVYNRAFNSPSPVDLFIDFETAQAGPFSVRLASIPRGGFSFPVNCDGPCMRSPFLDPSQTVPADATLTWAAVMELLRETMPGLPDIPAPGSGQVASRFGVLDPGGNGFLPFDPASLGDIDPLERTITNAVELGYRGVINDRFSIGADAHFTRVENPTGALYAATPNVFYDQATLEAYLAGIVGPETAAELAGEIAAIPVGTVSPREVGASSDILLLIPQGGSYSNLGMDLDLDYVAGGGWWFGATYSWILHDAFEDVGPVGDVILGVPRNKGMLSGGYRDAASGVDGALHARLVESYRVASGVYRGWVEPHEVFDLNVGWRLPWDRRVKLAVSARNIFNQRHREYVGAPLLGRLVLGKVNVTF